MAPDKRDKKRKATSAAAVAAADPPNKKTKKASTTEKTPVAAPKPTTKKDSAVKSTVPKASSEPARKIKPRKQASDFLSDDENDKSNELEEVEEVKKPAKKQQQSVKSTKEKAEKKTVPAKTKKVEIVEQDDESEPEADNIPDEEEAEEQDELDDQTADLIKGFESSGDEDASEDEGFEAGKPVPRIPDSKKAKRKIQKKLKESTQPEEPGTVYVGRIPHGFYEHQMKAYFSQFGEITRLRLSRNRVTGRSKHYAFIEFASTVVAKIVAETMNNYLMYGHILKCKYVPQEQQHPELFKGANRRYKRVPWNRIEKQRLDRGKTRDKWARSIEQESKRRLAKAEKMKQLGYEFDMPDLKAIDQVPVQEKLPASEPTAAIEEKDKDTTNEVATVNGADKEVEKVAVADEETPKKKPSKKTKKDKEPAASPAVSTPVKSTEEEKQATPLPTPGSSAKKTKAKKVKKSAGKA